MVLLIEKGGHSEGLDNVRGKQGTGIVNGLSQTSLAIVY
jgi:hypothetical protein